MVNEPIRIDVKFSKDFQTECCTPENWDLNFNNATLIAANKTLTNVNDSLSSEFTITDNSTVVIIYCILFVIAAVGNLTVFITLFKSRHRKSRISLMITHLSVADLVVTFFMIPLEVGWRLSVQWFAGNFACKLFLLLRAFGPYLSNNVLVCVSLDRYFAILHPLRVNDARRRGKIMLACAWIVSFIYSMPQSFVFHLAPHPTIPSFYQCVTFGTMSPNQEIAYNIFCLLAMYFIPLMVIIVSYTAIMCEISHKSRETNGDCCQSTSGRMRLRRSDMTNIERARSRTLKMTVTIVVVFVLCWTPYVFMLLWFIIDRDSANKLPTWIQDGFFMMAVSNSCMNPLVYGSYAMNFRKECCRCLNCILCPRAHDGTSQLVRKGTDIDGVAGQGGMKRRVFKCVYTLRKVGSGATRSTAMLHGVMKSPAGTPQPPHEHHNHLAKSPVCAALTRRPSSIGHISLLSEPMVNNTATYRPSFHSEPTTTPQFPNSDFHHTGHHNNHLVECTTNVRAIL